jgi:hypothetical protein
MNLVEKEILLERRRFAGQVFALVASLVLFVLAIAQGLLYLDSLHLMAVKSGQPVPALAQAWWQILAIGLLALLGAGWKAYRVWKDSAGRIGRLLDEKHASSKNRLETSAELSRSSDAVAIAQRQETSDYLERNPARRSYTFALAIACCVTLFLINGALATKGIAALQKAQALALAEAKKADQPKAPDPYAKIDIVAPESETRATPIEEVVVKGDADSDNGFSAVTMQASINGGDEKSIPIDPALFNKGGETKFDQSLLLDELGAQPYDVISYYLQGTSRHATPLKVASQMQFIEVRPFREDIHKANGAEAAEKGSEKEFTSLNWLISQQIIIAKRTWILASNPLSSKDPAVVAETGKSGVAQDKIAGKTHELYQEMTQNGLPASIVDHLSQAETSMHQAVDEIKKPELLAASPLQRHALGELVEATKNFIKVMAMNAKSQAQKSEASDPFKDKQKLPPAPAASANNPIAKLDQLIKREENIVKDLSSPSSGAQTPGDSANPTPSPAPKGDQTAQATPSQQGSPSASPSPSPGQGQGGQPPGQSPSQGGQPSQTAASSPSSGSPPGSGQAGSQMARDQSQIGKELGDLQEQPETSASSTPALSEAQEAAQKSADKLAAQDQAGALNDSRAAEAAMLRAQAGMETEAARQLRDALAQAQQQLHDAAQSQLSATNPTDQAKVKDQAGAARDNLAQEKDRQAASGDPKLAQLADAMTRGYDQSGIPQKLAQLANAPGATPQDRADAAKLMSQFADQLSAKRLAMQTETQNLEDTLKRIDRVRDNMNSTRGTPEEQAQFARELQADLNTALADAKVLLPSDNQAGPDEKDQASAHGPETGLVPHTNPLPYMQGPIHPVSPAAFQALSEPLAVFREEIQQRLDFLRNQDVLAYLNPDQSPEQYRAQVEAYYERISREAKAAPANPPDQPPSH